MCDKFCRNSAIGFNNISSNKFNRFSQAINYIKNHRSKEQTIDASREMLSKQIARTFGHCPGYILDASNKTRANYYLKKT